LTNSLTLTQSGQTILVLALAIAALTIIAWLAGWLPWKAHSHFTRLRDDLDHGWRDLSGLAMIIVIALAFLWIALFALTIMATFGGVLAFWGNPSSGGLGLGAILAGLLGAPFLIWTTVIKQTTLGFQKEGHITDRISKAVEQLGAEKTVKVRATDADGRDITIEESKPNIEVRIGGILSLERIAQDSMRYDNGRDHVRVMEILCAYVRENAPASGARDHEFDEWEPLKDDPTDAERAAHGMQRTERFGENFSQRAIVEWAATLPAPRDDIVQALSVIGRRDAGQLRVEARWGKDAKPGAEWVFNRECPALVEPTDGSALPADILVDYQTRLMAWKKYIDGYAGYRPDLHNTNLQGAYFVDNVLSGSLLYNARMEGANLSTARMEGADLGSACMEGADLRKTRMEGAYLRKARMEGASLWQVRMEGADLREARMEGALLLQVRMAGANLSEARMEGANLSEARMQGANLHGARMEGVSLREARMDSTTKLLGAILNGAAIRFVDLRAVPITQAQLDRAFSDGSVRDMFPEGRIWPAHWPIWQLPDDGAHGIKEQLEKWRADPAAYIPPPPPL
jgi:uncharacterized protein YjbI with pentapeptide repeats